MLRTPIGALIGIVGSVVAVFKLFKSSLHDTQQTGDAYDNAMAGWSNTWDLFKKAVTTVDFSLFIRNAAEAAAAGRNLQSVIDELFERTNSINIMRASMSKENAELEETLRNTGLSYGERLAAGEKYLENMQEIYKQEEEAARDVRDAQLENLFALTKTREYASKEERERAKEEFADGIKNYNLTREKINAANELLRAEKAVNAIGFGPMSIETIKLLNDNLAEATENFRKLAGEQSTQILEFQRQYSLTTDEQVKQYVDAEIKYQNAQAATYNDQKRIVNSINSIRAQAANEYIQNKEKEQKAAADAAEKEAELVKNSAERNAKIIMDAEAKILGITQQMREETRDNELLTLKENYEKETEILQNQIRNDMNLSEEAKSALSRQLLVMEEQYQRQRQIIIDKYTQQEFENQINAKTEEYRSKLLAAQLQAAKAGDSPEAQLAAAKQVAMTEVEIVAEKLQAISTMENATQSQRLQAEIELQNAINKTGKIDKQIAQQRLQMTQQMLSSAASTVSAFSQMFDALAGEGEGFAAFSKMLAIFEVGLQQAIAIAGAVAKAAEFSIPWLLPVQIASSIAAVTAAIAQAVKATDSANVPSYATGGLVTGPGHWNFR